MEHPSALNEDFNISTTTSTSVLELAELIWRKVRGPEVPFRWVSYQPFEYDVPLRSPDVRKARERLGFEATTTLDSILDEVILIQKFFDCHYFLVEQGLERRGMLKAGNSPIHRVG